MNPDPSPTGAPATSTLILVPTELERRRLEDEGGFPEELGELQVGGFGPVAAAARTAQLIAQHRPSRVLLIGIAGSYDPERDPVGSARCFDSVALHGVGVGEGREFQSPPALGFPQWPGDATSDAIDDRLPLWFPAGIDAEELGGQLLTTCGASADPDQAAERTRRFASARAEDMEGFGVALACALTRTPVCVVRGISNAVGDRQRARWNIPQALAAARRLALAALESKSWPFPRERGA